MARESMIKRRIFVVAAACAISMISACDQDSALAPTGVVPPQLPRLNVGPPTASATLGVTSVTDPSISAELVTYPGPVFVEVRLTGAITQTVVNGGYYSQYSGPIYGPGIWVDGVHQSCYVNLMVYHGYGPTGFGACYRTPLPDTLHVDTALFKGVVTVRRGGAVPLSDWERTSGCGEACYAYSGSQTITITPVKFDLALSADKRTIPAPAQVKFAAAATPYAYEGSAVPFQAIKWEWKAEDGTTGQTVPCSPSANPCYTEVKESGTMTVTALVNGFEQRKSVKVEVIPCPTGDSVLDNQALRESLVAAMARSNPDSTPGSLKRREVAGLIFRTVDSLGVTRFYFKETPVYARQTACNNEWSIFFGNSPGDTPVALFHTHPNSVGEIVYGCKGGQQYPGGPGTPFKKPPEFDTGGGSNNDWDVIDRPAWQIPMYVMSKDGLMWRLDPHTPKSLRPSNPNYWRWKNAPGEACPSW